MTKKVLITHSSSYKSALDVDGVHVVELASCSDSGGPEYTYQFGKAGGGAPAHRHEWDETFYVLKGSATFLCGDIKERCSVGAFIFVPGGTVHSFEFGEEGCEMFNIAGAGSRALSVFKKLGEHKLSPTV